MTANRFAVSALAIFLGAAGLASAKAYGVPPGTPTPSFVQDHDRGDWDAPPQEFRDVQRQGFHDGIEGARRDVENHRQPNVNNRDEYRHPHVSSQDRHAYREGFRRGYDTAMSHLMHDHDHDRH